MIGRLFLKTIMPSLNLIHRSRLPDSLSSPAPAVVMVHGWLGNENVMWQFEKTLPSGVIAVSPRAPFQVESGYGWSPPSPPAPGGEGGRGDEGGLSALREFVSRLPEVYPVDPSRIVLMGFSQGAAMGYALALSEPAVIAGVAALAGFLPDGARQWIAPGRLAGKPVFIAHGAEDTAVPIEAAVSAREAMITCGADVTYAEYPTGHKMNAQGMRDLKAWLKAVLPE